MDLVHDQLATCKKLRVLIVVDTFSRYVPVLDPKFSYRGEDVVASIDRICRQTGHPKTIRVDQGSAFVSRDMGLWAYQRGVILDLSRPGKPIDTAFIEALNGRFRAECLKANWFLTLADAFKKLEAWHRDYNEERPHSAIGNKVPIMLTKSGGRLQPVTLSKVGKLCLRALQRWVADHQPSLAGEGLTACRPRRLACQAASAREPMPSLR